MSDSTVSRGLRLAAPLFLLAGLSASARAQCSPNVVFFEDFEGPLNGWTMTGDWMVEPPSYCKPTCSQGLTAGLVLNLSNGCMCDNIGNPGTPDCEGDLKSPWISLPALAPGDRLELLFCADLLKITNDFPQGAGNCHRLSVRTALGGGELFILLAVDDLVAHGCPGPVVAPPFDLSAYAGQSIQLTWSGGQIDSDGGRSIFNVDDVLVLHTPSATSNHCTSLPNSSGAPATMSSSGTTSVAANDFVLEAQDCPKGQVGVFFLASSPASTPFGNGVLCVAGAVDRFPAFVVVQPDGSAALAVDNQSPPAQGKLLPGTTWNFQFWFRDPNAGGAQFNLSDGLAATFCP